MEKDQYLHVQSMVLTLGKIASEINLEPFIEQIETAIKEGAEMDPSIFKQAFENITAVRDLALALNVVKTTFKSHFSARLLEEQKLKALKDMKATAEILD